MVKVLTSHHIIWHPELVVAKIIKEYQTTGQCLIDLNAEGPCADTIGLYRLLDAVCEQFEFDTKKICIRTANHEEQSDRYRIEILHNDHWFGSTIAAYRTLPQLPQKSFEHLFGCLYNLPSWDRLCLLSYIWRNSPQSNLLSCNGSWLPDQYNTYYLNSLIDHAPQELLNVANYLASNPQPALNDTAHGKPITALHMMQVWPLYSKFFVDVVAETYNMGMSFFCTEKILRPILALTPFIVNAPAGFISILRHDFGFETFDQWWDEDYDNYQGYERIQKIYQIIDELDHQSPQHWQKMYQEMMPVLEHNKKQLLKHEQRR